MNAVRPAVSVTVTSRAPATRLRFWVRRTYRPSQTRNSPVTVMKEITETDSADVDTDI